LAAVWDTTLASQIRVGTPAYEHCIGRLATSDPVLIAAGAVFETAHGYESAAERRPEFAALLDEFREDVVRETICRVLPMDGLAALVAGRLLARSMPPANSKDKRSKAARRRAWLLDIQIAATCWAAGHDVATENEGDFTQIASALAKLYPDAPPLAVEGRPY
jgi:predicted nucleic acid-binding protein